MKYTRRRRFVATLVLLAGVLLLVAFSPDNYQQPVEQRPSPSSSQIEVEEASVALERLEVKGRASKTGYSRQQFGSGWATMDGCDMRNRILARDMENITVDEQCRVLSGILNDPYTGKQIEFTRGASTSGLVQIDHVVALSDAWQKGAQGLTLAQRTALANDPLELIAVDGPANMNKSSSDAASWLPPNKVFRCQYVARQIAVKQKYRLWVTVAEKQAMTTVLSRCPGQLLPVDRQ